MDVHSGKLYFTTEKSCITAKETLKVAYVNFAAFYPGVITPKSKHKPTVDQLMVGSTISKGPGEVEVLSS